MKVSECYNWCTIIGVVSCGDWGTTSNCLIFFRSLQSRTNSDIRLWVVTYPVRITLLVSCPPRTKNPGDATVYYLTRGCHSKPGLRTLVKVNVQKSGHLLQRLFHFVTRSIFQSWN